MEVAGKYALVGINCLFKHVRWYVFFFFFAYFADVSTLQCGRTFGQLFLRVMMFYSHFRILSQIWLWLAGPHYFIQVFLYLQQMKILGA